MIVPYLGTQYHEGAKNEAHQTFGYFRGILVIKRDFGDADKNDNYRFNHLKNYLYLSDYEKI